MAKTHHVSDKVYSRTLEGHARALFPHAVSVDGGRTVYLSGQLAWDRNGDTVGRGDMPAQLRQVGENLKAALEEAGGTLADIVKITTFVTDMEQFFTCIGVRDEYFGPGWPCSTTVEVTRLAHPDMLIEVEAIAVIAG
jgi:enamine deaminase RidA (YjgF/YER057c/UK114 family)